MQNLLILNPNKTEVIIVDPRELKDKLSLNDTSFASNNAVKVLFDQVLSFNFSFNNLPRTVFA